MDTYRIEEIIEFYNQECKKKGFNRIHTLAPMGNIKKGTELENFDTIVLREPDIGITIQSFL